MDRAKIIIKSIAKRLFLISMAVFVLIYIWWFRLTPWDTKNENYTNINYRVGLILLFLYVGAAIFWWFAKNRAFLGMFFGSITIFFFLLNSLCIAVFMPRVIDTAKYNRTTYYLVSYSTWPDAPWTLHQLTKWQGFFGYDSHDVGVSGSLEIRYDKKMQLVSVVKVFPTNYERLIYLDSLPSRRFDEIEVEFEGERYYPSYECNRNPKYPYLCETYTYMLYQCELDNTLCKPLPFRYTGDYAFEMYIERGNNTNDINVFFDIGDYPGIKTLIFIVSDHPRCYVEGCEILK